MGKEVHSKKIGLGNEELYEKNSENVEVEHKNETKRLEGAQTRLPDNDIIFTKEQPILITYQSLDNGAIVQRYIQKV